MSDDNRKVLEKLRRLNKLAQNAATFGERQAAEAARRRLVERLEKEGVHVAPELVAEVGAAQQTQPLPVDGDASTYDLGQLGGDLGLGFDPGAATRVSPAAMPSAPYEPSAKTVVSFALEDSEPELEPLSVAEVPSLGLDEPSPKRPPAGSVPITAPLEMPSASDLRRRPIPGAEPTPIHNHAATDDLVIRAPVEISDVDWEEVEDRPSRPVATVVATAAEDPFVEKTPFMDRTPSYVPVPPAVPVPNASTRPGLQRPGPFVARTPPMGVPLPDPSSTGARARVRRPASEPAEEGVIRWSKKRLIATIVGAVVAIEGGLWAVGINPVAPEPTPRSASAPERRPRTIDALMRECRNGGTDSCDRVGRKVAGLSEGQVWAPSDDFEGCRRGMRVSCSRLGQAFSMEARQADSAGPAFRELSCALDTFDCDR